MSCLTAHQQTVLLELRKTLATINKINVNLERSIALTAPQVNRTLNTRANPGGQIAQAQAKGLVSVESWIDTLAGGEEDEADGGQAGAAMEQD